MPPMISKQKPPTTTKSQTPIYKQGSILAQFAPLTEVAEWWVHMLLYGKNRIGKTTLACQFPKPLILVSMEMAQSGGAKSVVKIPGIQQRRFTDPDQVETLGHELRGYGERIPVKTVVLDSGTALDELVLAKICGWDETANMLKWGMVSQDQYRERSERMRQIIRPYLELPCHVIITANEKDHNAEKNERKSPVKQQIHTESFFAAAMGGGTTRWTQDCCDFIGHLFIDREVRKFTERLKLPGGKEKDVEREEETGKFIRKLRTAAHPNFSAGFRSADPDSLPDYIEAHKSSEMYAKLMKVIEGT